MTAGHVESSDEITDRTSRTAAGPIQVGCGVIVLPTNFVQVPDRAGLMAYGVALAPDLLAANVVSDFYVFTANQAVPILRRGSVWVRTEQAVDPTKPVYLRHTTNGTKVAGNFRTDDDGGRADLVPRSRWEVATRIPGLALLSLDAP